MADRIGDAISPWDGLAIIRIERFWTAGA